MPRQKGPVAGPASTIRVGRSPHYLTGWLTRRGPSNAVASSAPAAWYDIRDLATASQQLFTNRVGSGSAQRGATTDADGTDPVAITHTGENFVWFPGVSSSNYLSVADAAALDITGDIDIRAKVTPTSWTPSAASDICAKWAASNISYMARLNTNGTLLLSWSTNGTASISATSTAAVSASSGDTLWIRFVLDIDNGAGGYAVNFYQSADGASWTQIGSTVTGGAPTSIFSGSANLYIGNRQGSTENFPGKLHRLVILNGISGSTALDVNPATETLGQSSWICTTGQTVIVARASSGLATAVVTRPLLASDGTDDYVQLPAGDTPAFTHNSGSETVAILVRIHANAAEETIYSSGSNTHEAARVFITAAGVLTARAGDGTPTNVDSTVGTGLDNGALRLVAGIWDAGSVTAWDSAVGAGTPASYATLGAITHQQPRVSARAAGTAQAARHEVLAFVKWNRALSPAELALVATYLTGTYT